MGENMRLKDNAPMTSASTSVAHDVVDFWRQAGPKRWFAKNDAFDADFIARFAQPTRRPPAANSTTGWPTPKARSPCWCCSTSSRATPGATTRTCWPPTARRSRWRRRRCEAGFDQQLEAVLRPFFYLPFMHSEVLAEQERSVALNAALDANTQRFAVLHRDIVARFGRFPHRNKLLGRESTAEEQKYLDEGGFSG
jgi:uncharacterized protein (DUF924 family)